jgi:hypothetical protein
MTHSTMTRVGALSRLLARMRIVRVPNHGLAQEDRLTIRSYPRKWRANDRHWRGTLANEAGVQALSVSVENELFGVLFLRVVCDGRMSSLAARLAGDVGSGQVYAYLTEVGGVSRNNCHYGLAVLGYDAVQRCLSGDFISADNSLAVLRLERRSDPTDHAGHPGASLPPTLDSESRP